MEGYKRIWKKGKCIENKKYIWEKAKKSQKAKKPALIQTLILYVIEIYIINRIIVFTTTRFIFIKKNIYNIINVSFKEELLASWLLVVFI